MIEFAGSAAYTRPRRNVFCAAKARIGTYTICVCGDWYIYPTPAERL